MASVGSRTILYYHCVIRPAVPKVSDVCLGNPIDDFDSPFRLETASAYLKLLVRLPCFKNTYYVPLRRSGLFNVFCSTAIKVTRRDSTTMISSKHQFNTT